MIWVWNFILYSFFGFLLEVAYARATGGRGDRKSLLVLPLCPVYGVGACLILLLPRTVIQNPFTLFLLGGLAARASPSGIIPACRAASRGRYASPFPWPGGRWPSHSSTSSIRRWRG